MACVGIMYTNVYNGNSEFWTIMLDLGLFDQMYIIWYVARKSNPI